MTTCNPTGFSHRHLWSPKRAGLHTIIFVSWRRAADYKDNEVYKLKLIFLYGNIAIIFEMIVRRRPVDAVH